MQQHFPTHLCLHIYSKHLMVRKPPLSSSLCCLYSYIDWTGLFFSENVNEMTKVEKNRLSYD